MLVFFSSWKMRKYVCLHFGNRWFATRRQRRHSIVLKKNWKKDLRDSVARTRVCCSQLHAKIRQTHTNSQEIIQFWQECFYFSGCLLFLTVILENECKHCNWSIAITLLATYFNLYALNVETGICATMKVNRNMYTTNTNTQTQAHIFIFIHI